MAELVVLFPVLAFVTVALLALALVAPSETTTQSRLRAYGYDLARRPAGDLSRPFTQRVLLPIGRRLTGLVSRVTPTSVIASSRARLRQAHQTMGLSAYLLLRLLVAVLLPGVYVLPALRGASPPSVLTWLITLFLLYLGYRLPDMWLTFQIDARRDQITRGLPDALDLIVVCVEAGYGLEAAIARVSDATRGPLAEEFAQTLREISLGRPRREALRDMSERSGSPDLQTFIAAILQADQMGVSIADALRVQADAMRVRRRQRAEELIAKAPVKMLLPMTGFIFPALFAVLLGPAMLKIAAMFAGMR